MVPLGGRNKGKGGSRFGRFLKGKGKAVTAILVVLVLLVTATAMSISELITMFEESDEDEDQEGSFTEQVLYVRMTSGTPKKKGDPVKGATVTLTSQKGQNNQQAGDNIEMGPTDDNGEAYVVINGNTSLTAPCPKEFDTDGDGIPDKFEAKYSGGNTWYSMAVGPGSAYTSGPDGNTSNYSSRFGFARISASQNHLKDQSSKPAPSDTWHIVGRQMNDSTAAKRFPYHSMVYVQNAQGYSYGTALVEDCGSDIKKNGALLDCWAPYSKYYNPYREGKLSMSQYLKAMGVPCDKTGYPTVNFLKGTVYVLDTSSNGIAKQYESHITANGGQAWPGSAPSTPGKVADEKDQNHWYTVTCTNPDSNWPLKLDYQAAVAATRENPVVVDANPLHNWYYEFWSETITVGADGAGGDFDEAKKGISTGTFTDSKSGRTYTLFSQEAPSGYVVNGKDQTAWFHEHGCSPTSTAIVASGFGLKVTPMTVAGENNFSRAFRTNQRSITKRNVKVSACHGNRNISEVQKTLASGKPVIVLTGGGRVGNKTYGGHWYALLGLKGNKAFLADPGWWGTKNNGWYSFSSLQFEQWYAIG